MATTEHPYEFKLIKAREINVDPTYQRPEKRKMVKEIINEFDYHKVNCVKVCLRKDRQYYAFDGQQTTIGLRTKFGNNYLVPCMVYYDVPTWADEAILYEGTNVKKAKCPVSITELWKSRLARGEENAVKMQRIAERYGLVLKSNVSGTQRGHIKALRALDYIFETYGEAVYEETISVIAAAWNGDPDSLASQMLKGLALFVNAFDGKYDRSRLVKKLHDEPPKSIIKAGNSSSAKTSAKYAVEILNIYNSNLGKDSPNRLSEVNLYDRKK